MTLAPGARIGVYHIAHDVAPDGQRFLTNLVTGTEPPVQTPVTIVTNWTSFLRADR